MREEVEKMENAREKPAMQFEEPDEDTKLDESWSASSSSGGGEDHILAYRARWAKKQNCEMSKKKSKYFYVEDGSVDMTCLNEIGSSAVA